MTPIVYRTPEGRATPDRGRAAPPRGAERRRGSPGERPTVAMLACRALGASALAAVVLSALTPVPNWLARRHAVPARLGPADAIVVLGGNVTPAGSLGSSSLRRLVEGVRLHHQGLAPLLVLSGQPNARGPSEPEVRARLARELGVPPAAIVLAPAAGTTREEARRIVPMLLAGKARRILLVSDSLHLARAGPLFARAGLDVRAAPADDLALDATGAEARLRLARKVAREVLAGRYYGLTGAR